MRGKVENYKNESLTVVGPDRVNCELACFKYLFTKAIKWGYTDKNPERKVRLLKESSGRIRYLAKEEIDKLLGCSPSYLKPIIITALNTGMRKGEFLNLKWNNLDFQRRTIIIPTKVQLRKQV